LSIGLRSLARAGGSYRLKSALTGQQALGTLVFAASERDGAMPRRRRAQHFFTALAALLVLTGLLIGPRAAGAATSSCESWSGSQPPSPGTAANELEGVAMLSSCDVWAVGFDNSGGADHTLIVHWDGAAWTHVPSPSPGTTFSDLNGVSAVSATNIWAVGDESSGTVSKALILHWNGWVDEEQRHLALERPYLEAGSHP
jgi:hypothetical protein